MGGAQSALPYDALYREFLDRNCLETMPVARLAASVEGLEAGPGLLLHNLNFLTLEPATYAWVRYTEPEHVALLLYREDHPEHKQPTVEYIDSMADPNCARTLCFEYEVGEAARAQGVLYAGTRKM